MARLFPIYEYAGQNVAVMGLGKSGLTAARALAATGTRVHAWDDNPALRDAAKAEGLTITNLADLSDRRNDWPTMAAVIWSPGIPHTHPQSHPVARIARERHIPLFCDVELLLRAERDCFFVGITGTNGKSTTTALIGHIMKAAGHPTQVGGNLGIPALSLDPLPFYGTYVLELSSYQLELTPSLDCDVAVLLNITPDHLGRHGGMEGYIKAKRHIFDGGCGPHWAVVGIDDAPTRAIFEALRRLGRHRLVPISTQSLPKRGVGAVDGMLVDAMEGRKPREILDLLDIDSLPGEHNWQNAAAAYAACRARGLAPEVIAKAMRTFPGLPHRQELVAEIQGVRFVNDSKATNAEAADKALCCYENIYWIAGGQPKEGGIASLAPHFEHMRHAFLIGEAAPAFEQVLRGKVVTHRSGDLAKAVKQAADLAWSEGHEEAVVLLSPACASWDQFRSFEHRGDSFRALVSALHAPKDKAKGGRK
jgi:UDP-N-acetylmuramoylalanine--D-glutamate ligase